MTLISVVNIVYFLCSIFLVRGQHWLVVDPLGHCQDGAKYFPHNLIAGRSLLPVLLGIQLFQNNLTGTTTKIPEHVQHLTFYVMSTPDNTASGNYWTTMEDWPKNTMTSWYLQEDGTLKPTKPAQTVTKPSLSLASSSSSSSSYSYDPTNPTPTNGGNNLLMSCGPLDQRSIENRSDVVVFTSDALAAPLAITGELEVVLYVSTKNVNDTDFAVRLSDVHPDGTSQLVQYGIQRMRWRLSWDQKVPIPMVPNVVYKIRVSLWNTSFVFPTHHRLRLSISSSNHPRFEANPNTGVPLSMEDGTTIIAQNTVYHDATYPSNIR